MSSTFAFLHKLFFFCCDQKVFFWLCSFQKDIISTLIVFYYSTKLKGRVSACEDVKCGWILSLWEDRSNPNQYLLHGLYVLARRLQPCIFVSAPCVCLPWIVCCDTDKWCCTLRSSSSRLHPSWLSLLIAPSYYLSVKKRGGGPVSVCQKTIHLRRAPSPDAWLHRPPPSRFLTLWAPWFQHLFTPGHFHISCSW